MMDKPAKEKIVKPVIVHKLNMWHDKFDEIKDDLENEINFANKKMMGFGRPYPENFKAFSNKCMKQLKYAIF